MKLTQLPPRPTAARPKAPLRFRAALPALAFRPLGCSAAAHDFLVPNPRPDLSTDLRTLRMIEVG